VAPDVRFSIPARPVGKANIVFDVTKNGDKFGELLVSKGALVWKPLKKSAKLYKLDWSKFAKLAEENGREGPCA
jgi:hypothetical protein